MVGSKLHQDIIVWGVAVRVVDDLVAVAIDEGNFRHDEIVGSASDEGNQSHDTNVMNTRGYTRRTPGGGRGRSRDQPGRGARHLCFSQMQANQRSRSGGPGRI